jgi:hypothetical protein
MDFDFKRLIQSAAPMLGAAIGGPFGTMAGKLVAEALGKPEAKAEEIPALLAQATPEQIAALKQAEMDFKTRMAELGYANEQKLEELVVQDRQGARDRDVKLAQSGQRNYRADFMFLLAVAMTSSLVWIVWKDPAINEYVKGIFTLVLGRFLGYLDNIYNFEFGTTRGSKSKDTTIEQLSKGPQS